MTDLDGSIRDELDSTVQINHVTCIVKRELLSTCTHVYLGMLNLEMGFIAPFSVQPSIILDIQSHSTIVAM